MKRLSFFQRLFFSYVFILFLFTALLLAFAYQPFLDFTRQGALKQLRSVGASASAILKLSSELGETKTHTLAQNLARENKIPFRIFLKKADGEWNLWLDTSGTSALAGPVENEVKAAFSGKSTWAIRPTPPENRETLILWMPVASGAAEVSAVVRLATPSEELHALFLDFVKPLLWTLLLLLAVGIIAAFFAFRSLTRPLFELTEMAERVALGDFAVTVRGAPDRELGQLSRSFNRMTERIGALFGELSLEKERLSAILGSTQEGIAVVSREGEILFCNEAFGRIVSAVPSEGQKYWEIVRNPLLSEFLGKTAQGEEVLVEEISHGGKIYFARAVYLPGQKARLIHLFDVTQERSIEQTKRDLVVNVSHELNTPLTSIKGFLETLERKEGDPEKRRYLEIALRNTERLIQMVRDLLMLSQLDKGKTSLSPEKVRLDTLIRQILPLFEKKMSEKNLELRLRIADDLPPIVADPYQIEQLVTNLLDNAVKYTDQGFVEIEARMEQGELIISVRDSGIGVPPGSEEKIFERFFVVDKSRSRKAGGTGLGLSIVKHIVALHGGAIRVHSPLGGGSDFQVRLPSV